MITLIFDHDYQNKIMRVAFAEGSLLATNADVASMRQQWLDALKSWHSPYKALIDTSNLEVNDDHGDLGAALTAFADLLAKFFLKKSAAYNSSGQEVEKLLPFIPCSSLEEASSLLGIRTRRSPEPGDFRSAILIENHFRQHTVEVSFAAAIALDSPEKLATFKQKLTNNLMQWHSSWNLLIDCSNLVMPEDFHQSFKEIERFLAGFFLKKIVGYSVKDKASVPFISFRSRHRAAAALENEGLFSGEDADCVSRKSKPLDRN